MNLSVIFTAYYPHHLQNTSDSTLQLLNSPLDVRISQFISLEGQTKHWPGFHLGLRGLAQAQSLFKTPSSPQEINLLHPSYLECIYVNFSS